MTYSKVLEMFILRGSKSTAKAQTSTKKYQFHLKPPISTKK